ncbi:cell surface protein [Delftia acidovorans]|uniref:cell surface protein n=1 Tax=Delftia acidovorans TaxID=80866 RepID=UPI0018D6F8E3|nr:cell surface protein [Delftia acidovorans]QPR37070.1 cell surface protein [Delftia acidovorans]
MKKNVLALSIAAMVGGLGFAGAASAGVIVGTATPTATTLGASDAASFVLSEGGTGHNLVVPYFSAQNGNMTVLHLVNTDTVNGKAVKVRFRGAANSDDLMDFQVFLSPQDVWTAAVTQGANGILQLASSDNTCTLPKLNSAPGATDGAKAANAVGYFNGTTARLNPKLSADARAAGSREGYVEIFNMADIPSAAVYGATADARSALYQTIKHNAAGVATCDTTVLNAAVLTTDHTTEATAAPRGLATPTTGLMGDWYIMNVPQTTTFSGAATALTAVTGAGAAARGNFVLFPQNATPVAAATANTVTADPLFRTANVGLAKTAAGAVSGGTFTNPVIRAGQYDLPDMSTPYFGALSATAPLTQAESLSQALAVTQVINQYANDASISGKTDWVFSMPTRRYSVALNYNGAGTTPAARVYSENILNGGVAFFHDGNTEVTNAAADARICVAADAQSFFGREEQFREDGAVLSPGEVATFRFCGETSVLSFADTGNSVLAASVARQDTGNSAFTRGWAFANVTNGGAGLPILGSSFQKLTNPSAGAGFSGTYGITWPHRYARVAP